ncbi:MAG: metallophosphoesterase [Treponema sp.]|nr:metallophosphoesterase [Treponema sp.]
MRKKKAAVLIAVSVFLAAWIFLSWIPVTEKITVNAHGKNNVDVRIVLITDLHSCFYGKDQTWLAKRIDSEKPDIAILAGDIFDDKIPDGNAQKLIEHLVKKYPCFYVTGNHEFWSGRASEMKDWVRNAGVHVL